MTASHNPKQYTGMKIVRAGALPVGGESGLMDIRDRAMADEEGSTPADASKAAHYDIWPSYVDRVLSWWT